MSYQLIKVFGLQRSGNHAIINWILGLDAEHMLFFNNQKVGRPLGGGGVSLPDEVKANEKRQDGKKIVYPELVNSFPEWGRSLVVSFENYDLAQYRQEVVDAPIEQLFGPPNSRVVVIVLRNPFCVATSLDRMLPAANTSDYYSRRVRKLCKDPVRAFGRIRNTIRVKKRGVRHHISGNAAAIMSLWPKYAEASQKKTLGQEKVVPIIYDFWLRSAISRHEAADLLDQKNADKFLDFISDAGGGSSYWGAGVDVEKIREHSCIERWKRSPSKKSWGK